MAVMSAADLATARKVFTDDTGAAREGVAITRAQLIAAVAAVDQWISDNAVAFNNALPAAAKASLTTAQKSRLFAAVQVRRFQVGA